MEGDANLVARVRSGDRGSFDELYDTYADDVFSMCLLILGDPAVARAAAGTAFALVARTRLNPLTDPDRLRSWLLELARGSALAWSGSPQARSVPVPHGVSAEEMIEGAIVPAPASLRVGLARTFDRAAIAAADRQPAHLGLRKVSSPETDLHDAPTEISRGDRNRRAEPVLVDVGDTRPYDGRSQDGLDPATIVPFPQAATSGTGREWRARPAITVAAALVLAVAGVTAAVSWPTSSNSISAEPFPDVTVAASSVPTGAAPDTPQPPKAVEAPKPPAALAPTVAGMFTSVPADERPAGTRVPSSPSRPTSGRDAPAPPAAPPTTDLPRTTEPPATGTPSDPTTEPVPTTTTQPPAPTDPAQSPTDAPAPTPTETLPAEPTTEGPVTGGPATEDPQTGQPSAQGPTTGQPSGPGPIIVGPITIPIVI